VNSFLSFFRLKKAAALRQEPMQSHMPTQSIQMMIPKKPISSTSWTLDLFGFNTFFYQKIRLVSS